MSTPAARLEVVAGKAAGASILVRDEIVLGRHADGPGRLAEDEEISRLHARLTLDPSGVCEIEDLGSTNGTYVNGLRISAPEALSLGDMIEVGQTTLAVRELPAPRRSSSKLFFPEEEMQDEEEADEPPSPPAPVPATPRYEPQPELGSEPEPEPGGHLFDQDPAEPKTEIEAAAVPAPVPAPEPVLEPESVPDAMPEPEAVAEPDAMPEPEAVAEPEAASDSVPAPLPAPAPVPVPAPSPELAAEPEPEGAQPPPPLNLQLEVDFVNREARVSLDRDSEPVRLVFEAGAWRVAPSSPHEEGDAP
jgi:pSer/pThr/pTyr-binding forkhead associated (FHA) protein